MADDNTTSSSNTNDDNVPARNAEKDPKDWVTGDEPMTGPQESYLNNLASQAGQELDTSGLSKGDASKKIEELQGEKDTPGLN